MVSGDELDLSDSDWIEPGQSFSLTLTETGTFYYRCGPHPRMTGTVIVA